MRQAPSPLPQLRLEHFCFSSNRKTALTFCFYEIPNAKPLRTFSRIALERRTPGQIRAAALSVCFRRICAMSGAST
jgi:hypothetical protein